MMIKNLLIILFIISFSTVTLCDELRDFRHKIEAYNDSEEQEHKRKMARVASVVEEDATMKNADTKELAQILAEKDGRDRLNILWLGWLWFLTSQKAYDKKTQDYYQEITACALADKQKFLSDHGVADFVKMSVDCRYLAETILSIAPKTTNPQATQMKARDILKRWNNA